jgi:hypothetical protein
MTQMQAAIASGLARNPLKRQGIFNVIKDYGPGRTVIEMHS